MSEREILSELLVSLDTETPRCPGQQPKENWKGGRDKGKGKSTRPGLYSSVRKTLSREKSGGQRAGISINNTNLD